MRVRVYSPSKTTMQSGRATKGSWALEYEIATPRRPEPLMGWISSGDTLNQVKIQFDSKEEALAFAQKKGWEVDLIEPHENRVTPKSYADNFRTDRPRVGRF